MEDQEKRKFSRAHFHGNGVLLKGSVQYPVQVEDLSLRGVLISCDQHLQLHEEVRFHLILTHSDIVIETEGVVVHKHGREYGIKFTLVDAEGMIHLRSIMEYNTEDFSGIENELFFLKN
ncbi:MAG: PilZ domain-containing protein [Spirochaetales bacterium]|nr:PilZ domain-containing protein [Spirochaetales bacterium]